MLLGAVFLALPSLRAADELEFAVPDDGRITLGVFDASGKLVRVLHRLARQEDFRVGENGLVTSWDGKNDAGERAAAGHYHVRGYLIGDDVRVAGEDFLFNDWAADPGFPAFQKIEDFSVLENGDVILLARGGANGSSSGGTAAVPSHTSDPDGNKSALTAQRPPDGVEGIPARNPGQVAPFFDVASGHLLARFSPDKGFVWSVKIEPTWDSVRFPQAPRQTDPAGHPLGGSVIVLPPSTPYVEFASLLAANSSLAFVLTPEGSGIYSLDDGRKNKWMPQGSGVAPLAIAASESRLFISSPGGLAETALPDLQHEEITHHPSAFTSMDAGNSTLVGASPEGVWIRQDGFKAVNLPVAIKSVALGMPGTFWFVGVEKDSTFVGQASFEGEVLRALRPAADDPKPEKIRASRTADNFAVMESLPGLQRLRVMARSEQGEWTIEWERTIRDAANFGFVDGKPVANAGGAPQNQDIRFRLKENPLTGKHDFLTLRAAFDGSGSRLVSPDGLPLLEVSSRNDLRRVSIQRGDKPESLGFLQGNGSFVEEFSVSGLDDILPLDAGGIDLP